MCMENVDLGIDVEEFTDGDYHELWKKRGRIQIRLVEKLGKCSHEVGETFIYDDPYHKPEGVCYALLHVLDLYTWRTALGFPSWDAAFVVVLVSACVAYLRRAEVPPSERIAYRSSVPKP